MTEREPIGVIGVGWVGAVTAACFAQLGHQIWARDIVPEKIEALSRGELPIHEPGLNELITSNAERLHFTTDMEELLDHAQLLFVCVDTPPTYSGDADLSRVEAAIAELGDSQEHALVMKSTVPVGTGRSIERRRERIGYVSNPEFLKEGSAVADFMNPDRVVVGANDGSERYADRVEALYTPLGAEVVRTDVASAEMIKLASNAFLATKISFINEIANVSEEVGADVKEVSRGMGLDDRIGPKFLNAGIGFGGSCLAGEETVLARRRGRTELISLERLHRHLDAEEEGRDGVVLPAGLEVLAWLPDGEEPQFLPVLAATRRAYDGELLEVRTKMGRRIACTPDHPFIVADGEDAATRVKLARDLTPVDWLPIAQGRRGDESVAAGALLAAAEAAELHAEQVVLRLPPERVGEVVGRPLAERRAMVAAAGPRTGEVKRTGAMRLDEAARGDVALRGATLRTASNGNFLPEAISLDPAFWRVVGLYLAEGHSTSEANGTGRVCWSFHPTREQRLVDEVVAFFTRHGLAARSARRPTAHDVVVQSRLFAAWWTRVLGLGRNSHRQRLPDLVWDRHAADKCALLSGLWEGDGSWSLLNGGPSVILELATVSRELADGVQRLLGDLGLVASQKIGRTAKSTRDTYWLRISGAEQVERAIELVPAHDRPGVGASISRQAKRIAPTGYRRFAGGPAWARVAEIHRRPFTGHVYSLEVPGAHTFVTTAGVTVHNCFPKDVSALKQLAGNSGYHFQLLTAVIEVNELQKRRVLSKLQKHLGSLVGRDVALLGLAFKPNTDDMREASSLVLAGRLQADGARVRAFDPIAEEEARGLLPGVQFSASALDAVDGADAVVIVTEWPEFAEMDFDEVARRMRGTLVVDGRNLLDPAPVTAAGLDYEGIGRPAVARPRALEELGSA